MELIPYSSFSPQMTLICVPLTNTNHTMHKYKALNSDFQNQIKQNKNQAWLLAL